MGMRELRAAYGNKTTPSAINAAIRAELPGGSIVLDLLAGAFPKRNIDAEWSQQYADLAKLRDEMFNVIAEKYGLKSRKDTSHE